jgi:glucosamine--fructose-6-phosphate aminotransferase (isomerizing)
MREDISRQPQALRDLVAAYAIPGAVAGLAGLMARPPVLAGMGASLHAAQIAAAHMQRLGVPAVAVEAAELHYYGGALLQDGRPLVFVSQSGKSPEVEPILDSLPPGHPVLAVTNEPESVLARRATGVLAIHASAEKGVATRSYVNTLAALWLLARRWAGADPAGNLAAIERVVSLCDGLVAGGALDRWMEALAEAEPLVFLGHGPHAATARQAAMMLAERARVAATGLSVGAFRHGPIEIVQPGAGVVVFAAPGPAYASACALAELVRGYGARVLVVENGRTRDAAEPPAAAEPVDEFLSPILDVIPAQLFADALAGARGVPGEFRYLGKMPREV